MSSDALVELRRIDAWEEKMKRNGRHAATLTFLPLCNLYEEHGEGEEEISHHPVENESVETPAHSAQVSP